MADKISGIISTMVTPFKGDGIDYDTFAKQCEFLIQNGASALAYPMHYGESLNLRDSEFRECTRIMVEVAAGRLPTFVNVSSAGTDLACDSAKYAAKVGSTGIVTLPPYYWEPAPEQIIDHIVRVSKAHGGKVIVYNNFGATGVHITPAILQTLIEKLPGLCGVKDASFEMKTFTGFCEIAKSVPRLAIYTGIEYQLTSVPVGGSGCFSAASEVAPRLTKALYEACAAGKIAEARELQSKMHRLLGRLMQSYPSTIKHGMALMGRPVGDVRAPIRQINVEERKATEQLLQSLGLFESEPKGWGKAENVQRRKAAE